MNKLACFCICQYVYNHKRVDMYHPCACGCMHTDSCISMLTHSSEDSAKHKEGFVSTLVSTTDTAGASRNMLVRLVGTNKWSCFAGGFVCGGFE